MYWCGGNPFHKIQDLNRLLREAVHRRLVDPLDPAAIGSLDKHGNPNVLTLDKGTPKLANGSAQTALVEVERFDGEAPEITAFDTTESGPVHHTSVVLAPPIGG